MSLFPFVAPVGTGPVEILGVDTDTPASENGLRTSDLVVAINGLDARFMTHNEAVAAIRFGRGGYDAAIANGNGNGAAPPELDVVELTLVRPESLPVQVVSRRPSTYRPPQPSTPTPMITTASEEPRVMN